MRLLIPLAVVLFSLQSIGYRLIQIVFPGRRSVLRLFQFCFCFVAALLFFIKGGIPPVLSVEMLLFGSVYGLFFALTVLLCSIGYELGPMSLTSVISNLSFLIPTVYASVVDRIPLTWNLFVGFALFLGLFIVIALPQKKAKTKQIHPIWFPIVLIAFLSNGTTAVIQKHFGAFHPEEDLSAMMSIAYMTAALIFLFCFLLLSVRSSEKKPHRQESFKVLGLSLIAGSGSFGGNYLLGILCNTVDGSILYPCLNGGLCILCSIISFIFFKEKLYFTKIMAMILGISAILIMNL